MEHTVQIETHFRYGVSLFDPLTCVFGRPLLLMPLVQIHQCASWNLTRTTRQYIIPLIDVLIHVTSHKSRC
jgi:hypothetical protein